jgi:hypothetical protein
MHKKIKKILPRILQHKECFTTNNYPFKVRSTAKIIAQNFEKIGSKGVCLKFKPKLKLHLSAAEI